MEAAAMTTTQAPFGATAEGDEMVTCPRCGGAGGELSLEAQEAVKGIMDACYHCGTTGKVDRETARRDRIASYAAGLAHNLVSAQRAAANADPDGDGWDMGAHENGLSTFDYFRTCVWDETPAIEEALLAMDATPHGRRVMDLIMDREDAREEAEQRRADEARQASAAKATAAHRMATISSDDVACAMAVVEFFANLGQLSEAAFDGFPF